MFPPHVYEFAIDVNRHNLDSPHSLHDSWVTSILVKDNRKLNRPFDPSPEIEITLLGQMHDRDIVLAYSGISEYKLDVKETPYNSGDTFHGDISCHEVRLGKEGFIVHDILLCSESTIRIECKDFRCSERPYT